MVAAMNKLLSNNKDALITAMVTLLRTPFSSLLNICVLATSMLLPLMVYTAYKSVEMHSTDLRASPQIILYFTEEVSDSEANLIYQSVELNTGVESARLVNKQAALEEFLAITELNEQVELLGRNPLPASIEVTPAIGFTTERKLSELKVEFSKIDGIDRIQLDLDWIKRVNTTIKTLGTIAIAICAVLLVSLIISIHHVIRLHLVQHRDEIELSKLIGATNAYIRKPYLYTGVLLGLFGSLFALLGLYAVGVLLEPDIQQLSALYNNSMIFSAPSALEILAFIVSGIFLGYLAARIALSLLLRQFEPY